MKTIEKYIQFWIENGFKYKPYKRDTITLEDMLIDKEFLEEWIEAKGYLKIITSKEFIGAIARGLHKKNNYTDWIALSVDFLTKNQAIHIREGTLDLFIKELLWE